jgi:thioredoxin reductase (NADPH)
MRAAVTPIAAAAGVTLDEVDVDRDPALDARWGTSVPVLLAGEQELCHYRLDRAALDAYLSRAPR